MSCSVIVPTYNRLGYLKKCLASLRNLDHQDFELVVVDDASTDGTREFLESWQDDRVRVIRQPMNQGVARARNVGIKVASGEVLAFIDDDCVAEPAWLGSLLQGFTNEEIGFVIGQTFYARPGYKGYFPERLVSNVGARWPMTSNIAFRRQVFNKCGGFDDFFLQYNNEDSEMAIRAVTQGFDFVREKAAVVYHQPADWTVASLWRSARNASVWPVLKKYYPETYMVFGPPVSGGWLVNGMDYFYILTAPILIPALLLRYLWHGKRDLKIFFAKWPIYIFLRRFYIYKEAIKNRVWML
ncbi:MAG: glycosyltransferase family 2 protein [Patescibacteria group bacterium]|nr:glycosyltransferase family 2 protein [Patescibacteria group bacterium]